MRPGRRRWMLLVRVLVVGAAVAFLIRSVGSGWDDVAEALGALATERLDLVALALALEVFWVLSLAQVYRSSLSAFGAETGFTPTLKVSMGAFTLSRVLPGGGAVGALLAAREFMRLGTSGARTLVALVAAGWISMFALSGVITAGIGIGVVAGDLSAVYLVVPLLAVTGLAAAGAGAWISMRWLPWRRRLVTVLSRIFRRWGNGVDPVELDAVLGSRMVSGPGLLKVLGWATFSWILDMAALLTVFAAFGQMVGVSVLSVGYGVANLITALPELTPGWLGVLEGSLSVTYAAHGVPAAISTAVVLAYRVVSFWLPVVAGVPYALSVLKTHRPKMPEAVAA